MSEPELDRVRRIALALPEVTERLSHGAPCFYVRNKRPLCYFHDREFGDDDRCELWCPARPGVQNELVENDPARFFAPTPSASGVFAHWIGVVLDDAHDGRREWDEIEAIIEDAYRLVAPKQLVARLDRG